MNDVIRIIKRHRFWSVILAVVIFFLSFLLVGWPKETKNMQYGISWSKPYAEELGLDSLRSLEFALDDLGVRRVRLPAYWNLIEAERNKMDFSWLDEHVEAIAKRQGSVILVVGSRLPRWPECWAPDWTKGLNPEDRKREQLEYVRAVHTRYASNPAIIAWQVENEVALTIYAKCDGLTKDLAVEEMKLVRELEGERPIHLQRPIATTDSGELSTWLSFANEIDSKGVSVYRVLDNPFLGVFRHKLIPPWFYGRKAMLVRPFTKDIYVSEFQMEPWASKPLKTLSNEELFKTFDLKQQQDNLWYAKNLGLDRVDFWGAEWWLWMKDKRDYPAIWERMKPVFRK